MRMQRCTLHLLLALLGAGLLSGCDFGGQNFDYESGSTLDVEGETEVIVPDTTDYFVRAFTIEKNYEWSVPGAAEIVEVRRRGEYVDVGFTEKGMDSIKVSDGEYTGALAVQAVLTDPADQVSRQGFSVLSTAVTAAGLENALSAEDQELTVMGPSDAAFVEALDANDDGEVGDDELPSDGVLADILRYHVIPDSLGSEAITDGASVPTLLGDNQTLTFAVSNGTITVNGANVVQPFDLPVVGGYVHAIDQVLLPPVASSDFDDQESADGTTVTVAGVYLPDGGFVAMHEQQNDGSAGAVVGSSDYLEPGIHTGIEVELDNPVTDDTVLGAMPHTDDGDETYEFPALGQDGPYTKDGSAVIDYGTVTVPQ